MIDVRMCQGINCELASTCYRYRKEPIKGQSWLMYPPNKGSECDYYLEYKPDEE